MISPFKIISAAPSTECKLYFSAFPFGADNISATKQKIDSFSALPSGWHYGEGIAPSRSMIDNANEWHRKLRESGFVITDAFPGVSGEIMVVGYQGIHRTEIVIEIDGTLSFCYEKDDKELLTLEHASAIEVSDAIKEAAGEIWSSFASSIKDISNLRKIDSAAWHFETMAVARHSFTESVLKASAPHSAPTFGGTIQMQPVNHRSFGSLLTTNSPLEGR